MRLKELREAHNESQQKIAMMFNISQTMISRYELGQASPDVQMLIQLAEHYNVSVDYLIGISDVKMPYSKSELSESEQELLSLYSRLDAIKKEKAKAYIQGLLQN